METGQAAVMGLKAKKTDEETTPQPRGAATNDSPTEASSRGPAPISKTGTTSSALGVQGSNLSVNLIANPGLSQTGSSRTRQRSSTLLDSIASVTTGLRILILGQKVEGNPEGVVLVRGKDDPVQAPSVEQPSSSASKEPAQEGRLDDESASSNTTAEGMSAAEDERQEEVVVTSVVRNNRKKKEPAHPPPPDSTSNHPTPPPPSSSSSKPQPQRPSAPPSLSSIAHSLPTTSTTTPRQQDDTSVESEGGNDRSVSTSPTSTYATTEGETVAETQEAALAAISAVIQSTGQHYTAPLTTRAALLHQNNASLREQEYHLLKSTELLRRDGDAAMRLFKESSDKLKSLGDLGNWSKLIENELDVLEETGKIVEHGAVELDKCYACGEGIQEHSSDEDDREVERDAGGKGRGKARARERMRIESGREGRWCGDCGRAWHAACARESDNEDQADQDFKDNDKSHDRQELDDSVHGRSAPVKSQSRYVDQEQGREPKPSSMFEWGGWAGGDTDAGGSETSTISQGEGWRCWECNLKYDLEGIVDSLGEEEFGVREDGMGESSFDDIDALLNEGLGAPSIVPKS